MEGHHPAGPQPTFIQHWLEREKGNERKHLEHWRRKKREYFDGQRSFPGHIPESAMCNVNSMMYLISEYCPDGGVVVVVGGGGPGEGVDNDDDDDRRDNASLRSGRGNALVPATRGTALDDARRIAARCAEYRSIALHNISEFNYKRALKDVAIDKDQRRGDLPPPVPARPPHHPEYTPMSLRENFAMARIHGRNYELCLAMAACPDRAERMVSCWAGEDPGVVGIMDRHGMGRYICSEERKAVERCVGMEVQRAMNEILG
jgi:hypothetical protein